ncbi:MAG: peptide chain release factor 1 [Acidobacteriota bacterium]|nr:MAG: peptide chain release factor 1 [Acidobacteriota bacterium]
MFEKLDSIEERYNQLCIELGDPEVVSNPKRLEQTARVHSELEEIVEEYRRYKYLSEQVRQSKVLIEEESDPELVELAEEELDSLQERLSQCEQNLRLLLIPKDPNDERNVILEIRAGTGGDEATLFAQEIFRMYNRYAEAKRWKTELISANYSSVGGLKEVIATINGKRVYSRLRFESGVQRVQRVPETETQGRIHTSAITVAVLPEVEDVEVAIDPNELRIDTYCSSGPGGQSVNTTYSAVRITHLPTGEVVTCQDEKSQIKNKAKAMKVLRSRLYEKALQEQQDEIAANRRSMVGSGDRSEKIRTYNFPQNRVTDHRIGLTLHRLDSVMEGDLDEVIDALVTHFQAEALKELAIA